MHENNIRFIVEYCRKSCPKWAECISTALGFEKGDENDIRALLFCCKSVEEPDKDEKEIDAEVRKINLEAW